MSDSNRPIDDDGRRIRDASFLVQLRGESRPSEQRLSGRVEHLKSGESEPFGSLDELLAYMDRYSNR